ncbi:protein translocase SEC61 complex subunit gamma [Candidatus Woesearchaeota archaeon]|nr:protein translocase SEC61 complex subunit gamma [Candidatus Woesearchaeota archaeon]
MLSWQRFKDYLMENWRVLKVTKRPSKEEFKTIVKVTAIGMAVIGLVGFILIVLKQVFFGGA